MKYKYLITYILLIIMMVTGCSGTNENSTEKQQNITDVSFKNSHNQSVAEKVTQLLKDEEVVENAKTVNSDKELLVAVKINHMDRFRLKEINQRLKKKVKEEYPDYKVMLSTDQKIFLELDKLENKIKADQLGKKKLEKEMNRIKSLSKELT